MERIFGMNKTTNIPEPDPRCPPSTCVSVDDLLVSIWFLIADRIAPSLCCRYPPPLHRFFLAAVREVSRKDGDLDLAIRYLHEIIVSAPPEEMIFEQAGQLLHVIEWRRRYHQAWFPRGQRGTRIRPGTCGPYISRSMVMMQTGNDMAALDLTDRILSSPHADIGDRNLARLIRAAIHVCEGEVDAAESDISAILSESSIDC